MRKALLVGLGGMIGAVLRYAASIAIPDFLVLWIVNGLGSFVLGFLAGRALASKKEASVLWTTGVLGSFTTFSTFSAEWLSISQNDIGIAVLYGIAMTVWCFALAGFGMKWGNGLP